MTIRAWLLAQLTCQSSFEGNRCDSHHTFLIRQTRKNKRTCKSSHPSPARGGIKKHQRSPPLRRRRGKELNGEETTIHAHWRGRCRVYTNLRARSRRGEIGSY